VAGSVSFRFTPVLSFGVELTWSQLQDLPSNFGPPYYSSALVNPTRELISFTTNIRADLPRFHRVVPFVMGGGGVAVDSVAYDIDGASTQPTARIVDAATFLGLVAGAGASVLVTQHVSIDGEGKVLYMRGHRGQWGRVGVGVSYRF
jgi:opacity protein-like surface antigen